MPWSPSPRDPTAASAAFVVDRGPGFTSEDLTAKMGMPTSNTAMFELRDCKVPLTNLLGDESDGFRIAMGTLMSGRISVAAGRLGVIEDCLMEALNYARERKQHGKEIGRHQLVQEHIAMIEQHRAATEAMVTRAAQAKDASRREPSNAELRSRADLLAAQAKLFAANAAWDAADRAVQGVWRSRLVDAVPAGTPSPGRARCRIHEGTDEILKLKVAAAVLGKEYEAYK